MEKDNNKSLPPKEGRKGITHVKNTSNKDESFYPRDCYIEDFEMEKINTLEILENFQAIDDKN